MSDRLKPDKPRTGLAGFLQALAFSFLPWVAFFIAEFFGRTPFRIFIVDKGVIRLALFAATIYFSIALAAALLAFAASIPVSRVFFRSQVSPSLKVVRLAMISCLTPWSLLVILKFSEALSRVPLGVMIVGVPLSGTILVFGGLTTLYAFIGREDRRVGVTSLLTALGIMSWLGLALRFQSPNPWPLDVSLYTSVALGLLLFAARAAAFGGKKIPLPRLQQNPVIFLFSLGLPVLVLITSHSLGHIRVKATEASASKGKPNVVIFLPDTVRADHCSFHGYIRQTMKEISAEIGPGWTLFQKAASQATSTRPSVKSLFTSQVASSWGFAAYSDPPPRNAHTLANAFLKAGYRTACFSGVELIEGEGFETGFEKFVSWSGYRLARDSFALRHVVCRGDNLRVFRLVRPLKAHYPPGEIVLDMAEKWLASQEDSPFFLYLHTCDPHWPYYNHNLGMIPEQLRQYEDKLIFVDLLGVDSALQAAAIRGSPEFLNLVGRYDEELRYTDSLALRLISLLKQTGHWENTLFILIADHGEEFLDHDRFSHGHDIWEELTHVPMLIKWPQRPDFLSLPECVASPVGLVDLYPTLVDYLGLPTPRVSMKGTSLREILEKGEDRDLRKPLFSESIFHGVIRGAYWEGNFKLRLEFSADVPPLASANLWVYDLKTDPEEKNPISPEDPSAREIALRGRNFFQEIWKSWPDRGDSKSKKAAKKDAKQPDKKSTLEKLKSLGYLK